MRVRMVMPVLKYVLVLILVACQAPISQPLASQVSVQQHKPLLSKESIQEAKKKIRPNTKDRLVFIKNENQEAVSWAVVYDPPIPATEDTVASDLNNFSAQATYSAYEDQFPHSSMMIVADFMQPVNITYGQYDDWYGTGLAIKHYGGWKNHPDLWISNVDEKGQKEPCSGLYSFKYNGVKVLEFQEQRYAGPSHYRNLPGLRHGLIKFAVPKMLVQEDNSASIAKTAACDQTSPSLSACLLGDCGATGTQRPGDAYCPANFMSRLDQHYQYIARLERELEALEENLATGAFDLRARDVSEDDFATQSLSQPFSIASSDPNNTIPIYGDEIPKEEPGTFRAIKKDGFEGAVDRVIGRFMLLQTKVSALEPQVLLILDQERRDTYSRFLIDTSQELLTRIRTLNGLKGSLNASCPRVQNPDPQPLPEVDIIYAGLTSQQDMLIQGRVLFTEQAPESYKVLTLDLDFGGDIELLDSSSFQVAVPVSGFFSIRIPYASYRFTEQYLNAFSFEGPFVDLTRRPNILVEVNARFQTQNYVTNPITFLRVSGEDTNVYGVCATPGSSANYYCRRLGQEKVNHQIIDAEVMLNALKNSNSDTVFDNFNTDNFYMAIGAITYVGVSNTLLEIVVPVSVVDLVPGEKVVKMGHKGLKNVVKYRGRIWQKGSEVWFFIQDKAYKFNRVDVSPIIYDGELFLKVRNVPKDVWDEDLGKLIPQRYHSLGDHIDKFKVGARSAYNYMDSSLMVLEQELTKLNASRFSAVNTKVKSIKRKLREADIELKKENFTDVNSTKASGIINEAAGDLYELQLLRGFLSNKNIKVESFGAKYPIEPHLFTEHGVQAQEIDFIISHNGVKTIVEVKKSAEVKFPIKRDQLERLISSAKLQGISHIQYTTGVFDLKFEKKFREIAEWYRESGIKIDLRVIEHD